MTFRARIIAAALCLLPAGGQAGSVWDSTWNWAGEAWQSTLDLLKDPADAGGFARLWDGIIPRLEQTLALEDRHHRLPRDAWFGEDRQSNQAAINELLDESIAILSLSPARQYRQRIGELEQSIRDARQEIAALRQRRVSAPADALWRKTAEDYDAAIGQLNDRIAAQQAELNVVRQAFARELQDLGLHVSDEQLAFLLSTVTGDDLLELGIAFDNVKALTGQLEKLMAESPGDLEAARRYYGMYMVLLKVLDRMHLHLLEAVNGRYLPRIDAIAARTRQLRQETLALQRGAADGRFLEANLEAQTLTLRTAALYRDYLVEQSREVAEARRRLSRDIAVAANTYETVKVSGELVALMQDSQRLLDVLFSRQVPALRTFDNLAMKREFEKLTARLRSGERI
ncbi:MAG: hypothetical protein M3Z21_11835 [Pseudomonadota bacterium]|nr:hypothetical protein [Pseudomonadota bacterium]